MLTTTRPTSAPRHRKTACKRPSRAKPIFTPEELEALKEAYGPSIMKLYIAVARDEVIAERQAKANASQLVALSPSVPLASVADAGGNDAGRVVSQTVVGVGKNRNRKQGKSKRS